MHTSWSEIDTYRQCAFKHHARYKLDRQSTRPSRALTIGKMWHKLLELLYQTGDPAEPLAELKIWKAEEKEHTDLLVWMLEGYFSQYGVGDPFWVANVEAVELEFLLPLPDIGWGELDFKGSIDLLVWIDGRLWVVDHKTGGDKPRLKELELADQWTLYTWAARELGYEVFGSIHSYTKTRRLKREQPLDERFERFPIHRTDQECARVLREATIQAWAAKSDNGAPRSPGDHCFYRCDFIDVCIASRRFNDDMALHILNHEFVERERS